MLLAVAAQSLFCNLIEPTLDVKGANVLHPHTPTPRLKMISQNTAIPFDGGGPLGPLDPGKISASNNLADGSDPLGWILPAVDGCHVLLGRLFDVRGRMLAAG